MRTEIVEHDPESPETKVDDFALAEAKLRHYILGNPTPSHGITQGEALDSLRTLALGVAFWRNWWMPIFCGGMVLGAVVAIITLKIAGGMP